MPKRIVHDSDDDDEELSLESQSVEPRPSRSLSPDELAPLNGTGSTERLRREAGGPLVVLEPSTAERKGRSRRLSDRDHGQPQGHERDVSGDSRNHAKSEGQADGAAGDVWDIPHSSPPEVVAPSSRKARAHSDQKHLTSSDIRKRYQDTPTEAATSSTSNREKLLELSRTTADSTVSLDGAVDVDPTYPPTRKDDVRVMLPKQQQSDHATETPKRSGKTQRKRDRSPDDYDPNEMTKSDELAIGLPKEQYRPRPSARRGSPSPVVEDVENVQRNTKKPSRAKRRKTNADAEVLEDAIHDGTAQMVDMGFSPGKAHSALRQTDGDVDRATDLLVHGGLGGLDGVDESDDPIPVEDSPIAPEPAGSLADDESHTAAHSLEPTPGKTTARKKRGRPKKQAVTEATSNERGQWTDSQINADTQSAPAAHRQSSAKKQKKGRGRPKRDKKDTTESKNLSAEYVDEDEPEPEPLAKVDEVGVVQPAATDEPLKVEEPHVDDEEDKENIETAAKIGESVDEEPSKKVPASKSTEAAKDTPAPAVSSLDKRPATPSQLQTSNYRVGLSKKSRFPSLLTKFRRPAS